MAPLDICASILAVACEMRSEACFRVLLLSFRPGSAWDSFLASMRSCLLEGLCTFAVVPAYETLFLCTHSPVQCHALACLSATFLGLNSGGCSSGKCCMY